MRNVDEFIQKNVEKSIQPQMYEIANELWDLLVVLDKKGYVRKKLYENVEEKRETYISVGKNCDRILSALNKFCDLYLDDDKRKKFFDFMRENEFTDPDLGHLLIVQLIFDFLLISESFKNLLIFVLKFSPKIPLGTFFKKLERITHETGASQKIAKRIDIDLRNSLAHFTFKSAEATIYSYNPVKKDNYWILKETKIKPSDLLEKIRNQRLIRGILFSIIVDWYGLP